MGWQAGHRQDTSDRRQPSFLDDELDVALACRDEGAQAAELSLHTGWRLWAEAELTNLIESGRPFTADDLRAVVGDPPDGQHRNGIGGMFIRASKAGRIRIDSYRPSSRPEARQRILRVWRGVS